MKRKLALALSALLLLAGCASAPAGEIPSAGQTGGADGELRELNVVLDRDLVEVSCNGDTVYFCKKMKAEADRKLVLCGEMTMEVGIL